MNPIFRIIAPAMACAIFATPALQAAAITSTWSGGTTTGTYTWESAGNWSNSPASATYPDNGVNSYRAIIGDATGDRVIQTSGAITVQKMDWSQSSSSGSNTLKLGGNFTIVNTGSANGTTNTWSNTSGSPSKLVLDLNGFNFTYSFNGNPSTTGFIANNMTVKSTGSAGGVFDVNGFAASGVTNFVVQDNVTIKTTRNSTNAVLSGSGNTFSTASTLWIANTGGNLTMGTNTLGNLTVGSSSNAFATAVTAVSTNTNIAGSVTINTYSGATGGAASTLAVGTGVTLKVGGNFTDAATDATTYGIGTITFNGGAGSQKQVSIGRTAVTTNFSVGDSGGTAGNVELMKSLATSGTVAVLGTSLLDVNTFSMTGGATTFSTGATLGLTFGTTNGLVSATNLTLNAFNLVLANSGAWTDGSDLTLFSYSGSLTGTPSLASITAPGLPNFSYSGLVNDTLNKTIYLDNVYLNPVPEPSTVALLLLSLGGFGVWIYRRRVANFSGPVS